MVRPADRDPQTGNGKGDKVKTISSVVCDWFNPCVVMDPVIFVLLHEKGAHIDLDCEEIREAFHQKFAKLLELEDGQPPSDFLYQVIRVSGVDLYRLEVENAVHYIPVEINA